MEDLIIKITKTEDEKLVVSSREVAANFEKRHDNVIRDIEELINQNSILSSENSILSSQKYFIESSYKVEGNNKTYKEYLLTRDGFSLLVMGFNGEKALNWKLQYINAFNQMEEYIKAANNEPLFTLESLQNEVYMAIQKGNYKKADSLMRLAKQAGRTNPKACRSDLQPLIDEFYTLDDAIIGQTKRGLLLNKNLLLEVLSKSGLSKRMIFIKLRELGYIETYTKNKYGKTIRAILDTNKKIV